MIELETHTIALSTNGNCDIIDITDEVQNLVVDRGFSEGNVVIFAGGSTGGITTIEYEPGLIRDYPDFFNRIIPADIPYEHDNTWHDGNGHSHVRASIQGSSLTVPFKNKKLLLGTWQQVIFVDFDNRARKRNIIVQIFGKK